MQQVPVGLLATLVCSMSVGWVVDALAVGVPLHPVMQVGQWCAVGEVSAAGPLLRSPTTLECMMTVWVCLQGVSTIAIHYIDTRHRDGPPGCSDGCIPPVILRAY